MAKQDLATGFPHVDQTIDPGSCVHYLDRASAMESIQALKRRTFALLDAKAGHRLLDVGCGTGDDVRALAQLVGSTGRVVGVDTSETMITEARKRAEGTGLPAEYRVGNAQQLDFADNTFDGCRAERTFQHLDNPQQALVEMVRVARPRAPIVVLDTDWGTWTVNAQDRAFTRKLLNFFCDSLRNGWIGRQLPALFHEAKLTDIAVSADTLMMTDYALAKQGALGDALDRALKAGVISATEAAAWTEELERAYRAGRFFTSVTMFCVSGRKPPSCSA